MITSKPCRDCATIITGAPQKRFCADCMKVRHATEIVTIPSGQAIPDFEPRRYLSGQGYIRLRWRVGPYRYVETYEHRVVAGAVSSNDHVHHIDHIKTNNAKSNLAVVSPQKHRTEHRRYNPETFVNLYGQGYSTQSIGRLTGADPAVVWRALKKSGVEIRSHLRVAIPKREN